MPMKRFSFIALLAALALFGAACSSDSSDDTTTTTEAMESTTTTEAMETTTTTEAAAEGQTIADIVVEAASSDPEQFTVLLAAVQAADPSILDALSDPSQTLTVFAPTDEAFTNLLAELEISADDLLASPDLDAILTYHVLGSVVTSADLVAAGEETTATTLLGEDLLIQVTDEGSVVFPDAGGGMVVTADVEASNGVIHVVDTVLIPPGLDL